jgi:hypothetical protein
MDPSLFELWLPIVLSSVAVFFASYIAWTISPHHKGDVKPVSDEAGLLNAVRNIPPGKYMFPWCDPKARNDPEAKKRFEVGPHGTLLVWPGPPNMARNLVVTFIFYLVVGVFVAYVGSAALDRGAPYLSVFRITGTAAVMAYCLGLIPHAIWFGRPARSVAMDILDGIVYGLLTAGFFGWLWPDAPMPAA